MHSSEMHYQSRGVFALCNSVPDVMRNISAWMNRKEKQTSRDVIHAARQQVASEASSGISHGDRGNKRNREVDEMDAMTPLVIPA
jgi:hypothetical protein